MAAAATKLQVILMVAMVATAQLAHGGAVICGLVTSKVSPCLNYIRGKGPLTAACCDGISSLNADASSTPDRQEACRCLKTLAGTVTGINYGIAGGLPGKCGVHLPFPINPSVDCNTIK